MERAQVVLLPSESKRLIAKALARTEAVTQAMAQGRIILAGGTTNAYLAEELLGEKIEKAAYTAGIVVKGKKDVTPQERRLTPLVLEKGRPSEQPWQEAIKEMGPGDLFIKGANALDPQGNVAVLVAAANGGTIGTALGWVAGRGIGFICPVGLEKLVPSIPDAVRATQYPTLAGTGLNCGLMPVVGAQVWTEVQALASLSGADVVPMAAGGVAGSEGAVQLALMGEESQVRQALLWVERVKGEPGITLPWE